MESESNMALFRARLGSSQSKAVGICAIMFVFNIASQLYDHKVLEQLSPKFTLYDRVVESIKVCLLKN